MWKLTWKKSTGKKTNKLFATLAELQKYAEEKKITVFDVYQKRPQYCKSEE